MCACDCGGDDCGLADPAVVAVVPIAEKVAVVNVIMPSSLLFAIDVAASRRIRAANRSVRNTKLGINPKHLSPNLYPNRVALTAILLSQPLQG